MILCFHQFFLISFIHSLHYYQYCIVSPHLLLVIIIDLNSSPLYQNSIVGPLVIKMKVKNYFVTLCDHVLVLDVLYKATNYIVNDVILHVHVHVHVYNYTILCDINDVGPLLSLSYQQMSLLFSTTLKPLVTGPTRKGQHLYKGRFQYP